MYSLSLTHTHTHRVSSGQGKPPPVVILDQPTGDDREEEEEEDDEYVVGDQIVPAVPGESFTHSTNSDLPDEGVEGTHSRCIGPSTVYSCAVYSR